MATYTEASVFEATIYRKETTDPVLAGTADAPANLAEGQLANRTRQLKDRMDDAGFPAAKSYAGYLNTLTQSGFYFAQSTAFNRPAGSPSGFVWVVNNGASNAAQWYVDSASDAVYFRRIIGATIGDWQKLAIDTGIGDITAFLQELIIAMLNPAGETGVVVSGLIPFNINTGAGTLQISSGVALIGTTFHQVDAYSGTYPVYINTSGEWTTVEPAGNYVEFDPYTSQRYIDVLRRAQAADGELKMIVTDSELSEFDGTGLGRWRFKGWALANSLNGTVDLRGRFIVGYHPSDADYDEPGKFGGSKTHTLTIDEMPTHRHGPSTIAQGESGLMRKSETGENVTISNTDTSQSGTEPDLTTAPAAIPQTGGGQAHENRPPYRVVVYIQKI